MARRKERRRHTRYGLAGSLPLLWIDENGNELVVRAQVVDVSTHGARFRVDHMLPWRAPVMFNHIGLGIAASGVVRFSSLKNGSFDTGIECRNGTGWKTPSEAPGPDRR